MGKSRAAASFRRLGVPVFDADRAVHDLLGPKGAALAAIEALFPGAVAGGAVDRARLGATVFADAGALKRLEAVLHPLVGRARGRFLRRATAKRARLVVLDIPLLFETGGEGQCDYSAVVSAPAFVQRARALARVGMTAAKLAGILQRQMSDRDKRRRADFVIPTGLGHRFSLNAIRRIATMLGFRLAAKPVSHARNRSRHRNHRA